MKKSYLCALIAASLAFVAGHSVAQTVVQTPSGYVVVPASPVVQPSYQVVQQPVIQQRDMKKEFRVKVSVRNNLSEQPLSEQKP